MRRLCARAGCLPGYEDCEGDPDECETDLSSIDDCGACGLACPRPPAHGSATCTVPTPGCGAECDAPFAVTRHATGVFCGPFGGAWASEGTPGAVGTCLTENPFTGECTCPAGFIERRIGTARTMTATGVVGLCELDVDTVPETGWGGFFVRNESRGTCLLQNRLTDACTCLPGTVADGELFQSENGSGDVLRFAFCRTGTASAAWAPFAGAFTTSTCTACVGGSDGCACPGSSTPLAFGTYARTLTIGPCNGTSTICIER